MKDKIIHLDINPFTLAKRLLIGGMIGLLVISVFLVGTSNPDPAWGKFWMIRPLIITPLAGAAGAAFNYFITLVIPQYGWRKILTIVLSAIVFVVGLWLGIVVGLDGTLWN